MADLATPYPTVERVFAGRRHEVSTAIVGLCDAMDAIPGVELYGPNYNPSDPHWWMNFRVFRSDIGWQALAFLGVIVEEEWDAPDHLAGPMLETARIVLVDHGGPLFQLASDGPATEIEILEQRIRFNLLRPEEQEKLGC